MAYAHVGHDCVIGDNVIMVNNASVSGHVYVGDWAILSGYALVHQYVHIGPHCFIGPAAFVYHDVPAFITAFGSPAEPRTINREGLKAPRLQRQSKSLWPIRPTSYSIAAACSWTKRSKR